MECTLAFMQRVPTPGLHSSIPSICELQCSDKLALPPWPMSSLLQTVDNSIPSKQQLTNDINMSINNQPQRAPAAWCFCCAQQARYWVWEGYAKQKKLVPKINNSQSNLANAASNVLLPCRRGIGTPSNTMLLRLPPRLFIPNRTWIRSAVFAHQSQVKLCDRQTDWQEHQ